MKKGLIRNLPGYTEFRSCCRFEKCEDEYPGWTGKEKYIVFSQFSRSDLESRFPEITKAISPYILIDASVSNALVEYKRNEDKHHWRAVHRQTNFGFDEFTEIHYPELVTDRMEEDVSLKMLLEQAMEQLTEVQRRRIKMRYFEGLTYAQIAKLEQATDPAVLKSVNAALEKMKKFLEEG